MAWQRMHSEEETKRETMRGFFPFSIGNQLTGTLHAVKVDPKTKRGFFIIRAEEPCTVNVRDTEESKTGQAEAVKGELIGVRKTGATAYLASLKIGTMVRIIYNGTKPHTGFNQKTGKMETTNMHDISIDVYVPDTTAAA
jgi:hypothetical protein